MLVLSRKQNEQIVISGGITITVLKTRGKTVRIGIEAPKKVRVLRGELPSKEDMTLECHDRRAATQCAARKETADPMDPQRWSINSMRQRVRLVRQQKQAAETRS